MGRALALVASLVGLSVAHAESSCPQGWSRFDHEGEVIGCQRPVAGSSYREYLVLTHVAATPQRLDAQMWQRLLDRIVGGLKRRDFIVTEPRRLVFYDQIKTPVVSDRDYTVEALRVDEPDGSTKILFSLRNDLGPPPDRHHTRIPALQAAWICEPDGKGGTHLRYRSYSEPGGSVPAWMVRGAQAKHAMADVLDLLRSMGLRP